MKGDNELSIGRNMGQGQGVVCKLFLKMACHRLKDSNALRESWRTGVRESSFLLSPPPPPFLDQARPCFRNAGPYYLRAWHRHSRTQASSRYLSDQRRLGTERDSARPGKKWQKSPRSTRKSPR